MTFRLKILRIRISRWQYGLVSARYEVVLGSYAPSQFCVSLGGCPHGGALSVFDLTVVGAGLRVRPYPKYAYTKT
jgi:hypothetical protein